MRQVVVIHGGDSFETYEEYLKYLKGVEISLDWGKGWKAGLSEALGEKYQVIAPRMPNSLNARYIEWKMWFEKYLALLDEDLILVGHSLGGVFLAKYLSQETCPKGVLGTFLVAAPFDAPEGSWDFILSGPLNSLAEQGGKLFLYQSKDDTLVPFAEVQKYQMALPGAVVRTFNDRGHFLGEEFPEIVADIRSVD